MNKTFSIFLLLIISVGMASCTNKEPNYAEHWKIWSDEQLKTWAYDTEIFHAQVITYCEQDGQIEPVQGSWIALSEQWARLNGLPYHAITDFNLSFEIYAWPDKRNMTEARLSQRISNGGAQISDLDSATAFEKGLLALEWLTFNTNMSKQEICSTLPAISGHYKRNINKISKHHIENPLVETEWIEGKDNPEGNSIALNLLFQQISQLSNRLRTSINTEGTIIPILSEGWSSSMTERLYKTSLQSIIVHIQALGERADISVNSLGLLEHQIGNLSLHLNDLQTAIQNKSKFDNWLQLQQAIIDLEQLTESSIAQDMGILIGFNNYDGD